MRSQLLVRLIIVLSLFASASVQAAIVCSPGGACVSVFDLENGQFNGVKIGQHIFYSSTNWSNEAVNIYWDSDLIGSYTGPAFTDCPLPGCNPATPGLYQVTHLDNADGPCASTFRAVSGANEAHLILYGRIAGRVAAADKALGDLTVLTDGDDPKTGEFLCDGVNYLMPNGTPDINNIPVSPHSLLALDLGSGSIAIVDNEVHVKSIGGFLHDGQVLYLGLLGDSLFPLNTFGVSAPPASVYNPPAGATALPATLSCTSPGGCPIAGAAFSAGDLTVTGTSGLNLQNALLYVNGNLTVDGGMQGIGGLFVRGNVVIRGATNFQPSGTAAITAGGNIFLCGDGTFSGGPCLAPPSCMFTISPASVNAPAAASTGMVSVMASSPSCPWTAAQGPNSAFLTITAGASGTGSGTVAYSIAGNAGAPRAGTLLIAGNTFTVNQAGAVTFTAMGSNGKSTEVLNGDTVTFNGTNWLPTGGPVTVTQDGNPTVGPFTPPNFSSSISNFTYSKTANPTCTSQLTATQGAVTASVTISGTVLGKVVLAENPAFGSSAILELTPGNTSPSPAVATGDTYCRGVAINDLLYFPPRVFPGAAFAIEGRALSGSGGSTVDIGGGVFALGDNEVPVNVAGLVIVAAGNTLTLPLSGGRKSSMISHATMPLPASLFTLSGTATELSGSLINATLSGLNHASGDLTVMGGLMLDNGVLLADGKVTITGGLKGLGAILARGQISIAGTVMLSAPDQVALASLSNIAFTTAPVSGDVNGDGVVDCLDIALVKLSFGRRTGQPGFNPAADVNGDGVVDIRDLAFVAQKLPAGTSCP